MVRVLTLPLCTLLPRETVWKVRLICGCAGDLRSALWRAGGILQICPTTNGLYLPTSSRAHRAGSSQASRLTSDPRRPLLRAQERLPVAPTAACNDVAPGSLAPSDALDGVPIFLHRAS